MMDQKDERVKVSFPHYYVMQERHMYRVQVLVMVQWLFLLCILSTASLSILDNFGEDKLSFYWYSRRYSMHVQHEKFVINRCINS